MWGEHYTQSFLKKFETFEQWAKDQHAHQKKLITAIRKLMKRVAPKLSESVKWGNGVWLGEEWPVAFLHAKADHLQFRFFGGSDLKDPKQFLQGSGKHIKHIKHIKVYVLSDIKVTEFARLIRQAARNERV